MINLQAVTYKFYMFIRIRKNLLFKIDYITMKGCFERVRIRDLGKNMADL